MCAVEAVDIGWHVVGKAWAKVCPEGFEYLDAPIELLLGQCRYPHCLIQQADVLSGREAVPAQPGQAPLAVGYEPAPEHVEQFDDLVDGRGENVVTGGDVAAKHHPLRCPPDVPLQPAGEPDQSIRSLGPAHPGLGLDEPADAAVTVID